MKYTAFNAAIFNFLNLAVAFEFHAIFYCNGVVKLFEYFF